MQSHPKLMELRPDRSLLNSDFDGYKLSLAEIPTISEQLKVPVDRLVPDVNQYSLLHAKLFALHNHLISENDNESVYFVDKELNVQKFSIESLTHTFCKTTVWTLPLQRERSFGDYNISLKFASSQIAVVADGMGYLYVLDRGCRDIDDKWKILFSGDVTGPDQKFVVTDVVFKEAPKPHLHLLLTSIRQREANERNSTILHWITLEKSDSWNQVALRELTVKGFVQYANFERTCDAVYVISDDGCKFTLDSENEIKKAEEIQVEKKYKWSQTSEDLTIKFPLPENFKKNLVHVTTEPTHISLKYENETLLTGKLYHQIDPDVTCWTIESSTLVLTLQKCESGLMWPEIVEGGDVFGEYLPDPALVSEIAERLAPLTSDTEMGPPTGTTFNSQQVEECDFECDKLTVFERVSRDSHEVTHKINLGSHQVLLSVGLEENQPLAVGIRSDVDTCIWQPTNENEFRLVHKGTLLALGYIQASKQQMKFFVASPDLSYAAICESTKHIFIYCQNKSIGLNQLRNRTTGKRVNALAQQQVFSLPSNEEILGIYASNTCLYVLGENFITALKL
ncbi:NudC domain-containing protein 1-like Protein [Tribolium castaneum]|uniref:NudC domain-containing protein 1 n=1 Tax=Tribolium castaneum TaxID=7070 RepID=D6WDT8_TRICA|nr:PREDICTED: nudC domain-containing protein 1 [Tribolium castaneum]EEZ99920.1 NudC domain-containing protein 1-like Protein [Tribolium castaneum]|eukprot:XP_967066.1 PREDICTED: nudC domain-containing protein 1 [Tribolium castaneum]